MDIPVTLTLLAGVIRKRKEEHSWPYHLFLTRSLSQHSTGEGYRALARLIREGFFTTILTSNTDIALELALKEQGLHPHQYKIFSVGQVSNERIAATLEGQESGIRIVKLYGDGPQTEQTSSLFKLPPDIKVSLQHYFNQNIIIVGCMDQEEDGICALHSHRERSIYYILQNDPPLDDIVVKSLHKQDKHLKDFLITGYYGEFNTFFCTLETKIKYRNQPPHTSRRNTLVVRHIPSSQDYLGRQPLVFEEKGESQLGPQQQSLPAATRPLPATTRPLPDLTDVSKITEKPTHTNGKTSTDVLLVTVTDIEAQAVFDLFPDRGQRVIAGRIYYDLGFVGTAKTFMVQSTGAGPAPTRICIEEGIQALSPAVVIMVGIAFGLRPDKHRMGDILVSNQIEDYDQQKIGTGPNGQQEIHARGDRVRASERLLHRFKVGRHDWSTPPDVHFGLILSGSKLVSHKGFRDELLHVNPEAIGGEMEGISLYEVGNRTHIEWILVKAICDWADDEKNDAYQMQAAKNATRFVIQVVSQDQFVHRQ